MSEHRLADALMRLERDIRALQTQPQLGHAAVEDAAIQSYRGDSLRLIVGTLPDGTVGALPVNGQPPPVPSAPILSAIRGGIVIHWNGTNANGGSIQPLDWARCEVHVTPAPSGSLHGTFETPLGGRYFFFGSPATAFTVWLTARNTSGIASAAGVSMTLNPGIY